MKTRSTEKLPLSPAVLHVLVALAREDLHGYGITQEIARQSDGQYKMGPGTLYDNLKKLMDQGLVVEVPKTELASDEIRRFYRMTLEGRAVVSAEVSRLEGVLREARLRLGNKRPRKA